MAGLRMAHGLWQGAGAMAVGLVTGVAVVACGAGNPPPGWANPYQAGTMTLVSPTEAVFTDSAGHRVVFTVRPGAKTFMNVCS